MYSAHRNLRAILAYLVLSAISCAIGLPQTSKLVRRSSDPPLFASLPPPAPACARELLNVPAGLRGANIAAGEAFSACDTPPTPTNPSVIDPCKVSNGVRTGCGTPGDAAQTELEAMGKAGRAISRAREKVLEILESSNACSAWFQEKDSNPAATFRTFSFELDRKGDEFVLKIIDPGPWNIFRSPYVAKVMQADGPYATITINAKGAFFRSEATVFEVSKEGGPSTPRGTRSLRVGPYMGATLPAQIVTLLHEFGHLIDLLPTDQDNLDGKSMHNTNEVLRYCGAAVEVPPKRSTLSATR